MKRYSEVYGDILPHIEDDLASGAFPDMGEGLHSTDLGNGIYAQYDEQDGSLLIAGVDRQMLLKRDAVDALIAFLSTIELG